MKLEALIEAQDAYIETALWSELDDNGEPLDNNYFIDDINDESLAEMRNDVSKFIKNCEYHMFEIFNGIDPKQIGHDFWLTRNHHGAGFWSRGLGDRGDWLADKAHPYGEAALYVGDDGMLHYLG